MATWVIGGQLAHQRFTFWVCPFDNIFNPAFFLERWVSEVQKRTLFFIFIMHRKMNVTDIHWIPVEHNNCYRGMEKPAMKRCFPQRIWENSNSGFPPQAMHTHIYNHRTVKSIILVVIEQQMHLLWFCVFLHYEGWTGSQRNSVEGFERCNWTECVLFHCQNLGL